MFKALDNMNIHLSPRKLFLGYSSIYLLGQKIDALELAITEEKLAIISQLSFSRSLAQLERYLRIIEYLRQYILNYAAVIKPL